MEENSNNNVNNIYSEISELVNKISNLAQKEISDSERNSILKEIWEKSKKKFILETQNNKNLKQYDGIIFTVGLSPEPIILNILANNPKAVFFIYTKKSEEILDKIMDETELKPTQYKREMMSRDSAADSYKLVKKGLNFLLEEKSIEKDKIALDPTGGTKIMSVGCGIAASIFNLDILYVNNKKYNIKLRRPEPGSEQLINVPNPFDIFQDDKLIEGLHYLKDFHFSSAKEIFNNIKQNSSNPLIPEFLSLIANSLYFWNMIDYFKALNSLNHSIKKLDLVKKEIPRIYPELYEIFSLSSWKNFLEIILEKVNQGQKEVEKISPLLIFDIIENAKRDFYKELYNNAALKYYRAIEMINQYVLFNKYGIDTQNPNYRNLKNIKFSNLNEDLAPEDKEILILRKYNLVWKEIFSKKKEISEFKEINLLPRKIGLLAGVILRYIFGDSDISKEFLFKIFQSIEKRNQSIFAHGISSINKRDCENLKKIAEKMMNSIDLNNELINQIFNKKSLEKFRDLILKIL